MLKVFICEDNEIQKKRFEDIIKNTILIENYDIELQLSSSDPYEILNYIESNNTSGLYFLDINLNSDINGIQLAEKIRTFDPRGFIVFITNHAEMSYLTFIYKVEAMDYIIKDNYSSIQQRIKDCIQNALTKYRGKVSDLQKNFSIKVDDKIINVDFNDIIFLETSSTIHKLILHCKNRQIEFYGKMKQVEAILDDRFCRCHNSFIINKDKLLEIDKKNRIAYMTTGDECLISTRCLKKLLSAQKK